MWLIYGILQFSVCCQVLRDADWRGKECRRIRSNSRDATLLLNVNIRRFSSGGTKAFIQQKEKESRHAEMIWVHSKTYERQDVSCIQWRQVANWTNSRRARIWEYNASMSRDSSFSPHLVLFVWRQAVNPNKHRFSRSIYVSEVKWALFLLLDRMLCWNKLDFWCRCWNFNGSVRSLTL